MGFSGDRIVITTIILILIYITWCLMFPKKFNEKLSQDATTNDSAKQQQLKGNTP